MSLWMGLMGLMGLLVMHIVGIAIIVLINAAYMSFKKETLSTKMEELPRGVYSCCPLVVTLSAFPEDDETKKEG